MKCEHCGGSVVVKYGNSQEASRLVCIACAREPRSESSINPSARPKAKELEVNKMEFKICRKCEEKKPLDEFPISRRCADGHENRCRKCKSAYQKDLWKRRKKETGTNGQPLAPSVRGRRKKRNHNPRTLVELPQPAKPASPAISESITLPVEVIRAIKRSVGKEIVGELSKFIEERFA